MLKRPLKFKRGDRGPFIVDIQQMFAKLGFEPGEPEGAFVAKTEDAVRVFQSEYGLEVTGVIDPETLRLLYDEADPEGYPATLIEGRTVHPEDHAISPGEREGVEEDAKPGKIGASEEPIVDRELVTREGLISDEGSVAGRASVAGERPIVGKGHIAAEELMDGRKTVDGKESTANGKPISTKELTAGREPIGGKEVTFDDEPTVAEGSTAGGHFTPQEGPKPDEESIATLAEVGPASTTGATGHTIVISLSEHALGLYQGNQLIRRYPVAIGKPSTPTPVGTHRVLEKVLYPGGGLGTRWIGFTYQMHGIHGTNRPEFIGQEVSNGCVRMHNANVEELYDMINVGTPVVVIVAPVQSWSSLGKPQSQEGAGSGQAWPGSGTTGPGSGTTGKPAGKPTGLLDPTGPQPKDPVGFGQSQSPTGSAASGTTSGRTYTVQPGDSIWAIARRFGTTVEAIVNVNKIRNPELIYPGEVLKIPG